MPTVVAEDTEARSFCHPGLSEHLWRTYYAPAIMLGSGSAAMSKTDAAPTQKEHTFLWSEAEFKR